MKRSVVSIQTNTVYPALDWATLITGVTTSVCRCVDQRSQSTHASTSLLAAPINVCNGNSGTVMTVGSDADDEDYILLPPVNLKNLCARHCGFGVNSKLERRNSSSVVVISDSDICWIRMSALSCSFKCSLHLDYTCTHQFQWHSKHVSLNLITIILLHFYCLLPSPVTNCCQYNTSEHICMKT